ncbi:hypothetical protein P2H44_22340 [Albimonas sp. CAU 1670]|nr:hypothetical protein [Albimonas sp. CAU 1670]MDF2235307.1 hypothetical protein [Albimonas sp. CAU 1670]
MAKGQKRSNREAKKPKTKKPTVAATAVSPFAKGELATTGAKKQK